MTSVIGGQTAGPGNGMIGGQTSHYIEKYRPHSLDDVVSQEHIVSTLTRLIDSKKLPHLLFYGPPGTGKTSTILACARRLYGPHFSSMVLELNASDDRGIEVVREQIKDFASTRKIFSSGVKLVVLDEADNMENTAQAALRRVIEKYTRNTRFCLICNYVNKIIPALQSRCMKFRFAPLQRGLILDRLQGISRLEGLEITEDGMTALIDMGGGDMRKCLNIMQATAMAYEGKVTSDGVYTCTGHPRPEDINAILTWMLNEDFKDAYDRIIQLKSERGLALQDIITQVHLVTLRVSLPEKTKADVLVRLGDLEHRLALGTNEAIQLGSLVGYYQLAKNEAVRVTEAKN